MSRRFNDQASYVATFLAVAVGLMVFRNELTSFSIVLMGWHTNLFWLFAMFISVMVLASYASALAVMSTVLNVTKFPLTAILESLSNFLIILGLLSPLIFIFIIFLAWSGRIIFTSIKIYNHFSPFAAAVIGLISGILVALMLTRLRNMRKLEERYYYWEIKHDELGIIRSEVSRNTKSMSNRTFSMKKRAWNYEFLEHYEYTLNYAKEYLRARGYGIRTTSIAFIARLLASKGVISNKLAKQLMNVNEVRDSIAHAKTKPNADELKKCAQSLDELFMIIQSNFAQLINDKKLGEK